MFNKRVIIVTGAASGIGLQLAERFAREGGVVMLSDLNDSALQTARKQLDELGYQAASVQADMTIEQDIINLIDQTVARFGRLDVLINNAGIQHVAPLENFPTNKFELMIKLMLTAPFIAIKHAIPIMKRQGFGRIINMSSINGLVGFAGKSAYNSAKHGIIGLTKAAALETADWHYHKCIVSGIC